MGRGIAVIVEAEPIDQRLIARQAKQARARIARLRPRRQRADLDKAEAGAEQPARRLGVLVEARRHAERIGEGQAEGRDAQGAGRIAARRRPRAARRRWRRDAPSRAPASAETAAPARRARASCVKISEDMAPVGAERQRARPAHGRKRQGRIEMRKQRAAARRLPAQSRRRAHRRRPPPARDRRARRTIWRPSRRPAPRVEKWM